MRFLFVIPEPDCLFAQNYLEVRRIVSSDKFSVGAQGKSQDLQTMPNNFLFEHIYGTCNRCQWFQHVNPLRRKLLHKSSSSQTSHRCDTNTSEISFASFVPDLLNMITNINNVRGSSNTDVCTCKVYKVVNVNPFCDQSRTCECFGGTCCFFVGFCLVRCVYDYNKHKNVHVQIANLNKFKYRSRSRNMLLCGFETDTKRTAARTERKRNEHDTNATLNKNKRFSKVFNNIETCRQHFYFQKNSQ